MPELPDVARFKQYADRTALHHRIEKAKAEAGKMLKDVSPSTLERRLRGHAFTQTRRHGKYLFLRLDDGSWLCLHFGMTGELAYFDESEAPPDYTRLLLKFDNHHRLAYISRRKLGRIALADDPDEFAADRGLGPDALSVDARRFRELAQGRTSTLKAWLMDQSLMAGIGNVYADEILFHAGILPRRKLDDLDKKDLDRLHRTMRRVLKTAVEKQADPEKMPKSWLLPRRRKGADCPRCKGRVEKSTVSSRSTYYCPACQH